MEFLNNIYFNIIDIFVISLILISCIVASYRGFIKEAFNIISWLTALIVALQLFKKIKFKLVDYINEQIIADILAFGMPFFLTLLLGSLISNWLSPKFTLPGLLIFDKIGGFIFGIIRGIFFIVLFYLGFLYLLEKDKDKPLPSILLEAVTFNYIQKTAEVTVKIFVKEVELINEDNKK